MKRQERNWGLIMGILSTMVIFPVALFAGVSEETAMVRALIGGAVGSFIGFGFNYLGSAVPARSEKGNNLDVLLSEIEEHATDLNLHTAASGFHPHDPPGDFLPMDLTQATRVVEKMTD